jgi:hypothetical protein
VPLTLDATTLTLLDQMIVAYLQQYNPPPFTGPCTISTGAPAIDTLLCAFDSEHRSFSSAAAISSGITSDLQYDLATLGSWQATSLSTVVIANPSVGTAAGYLWSLTMPFLTSALTPTAPPTLSAALLQSGSSVLTTGSQYGLPVTDLASQDMAVYVQMAQNPGSAVEYGAASGSGFSFPSNGLSTSGGLAVSGPNSGLPAGALGTLIFHRSLGGGGLLVGTYPQPSSGTVSSVTVTSPTLTSFDGAYTGGYSGSHIGGGGGPAAPDSGPVSLSISNGVITVTVPAPGSGALNATGLITIGNVTGGGYTCSFGGRVNLIGTKSSASGTYSCTTLGGGTSWGSWNATR